MNLWLQLLILMAKLDEITNMDSKAVKESISFSYVLQEEYEQMCVKLWNRFMLRAKRYGFCNQSSVRSRNVQFHLPVLDCSILGVG